MSRHRAPDSNDETTIIPKVVDTPEADAATPSGPASHPGVAGPAQRPVPAAEEATISVMAIGGGTDASNDTTTIIPKITFGSEAPPPSAVSVPVRALDPDATTTLPKVPADNSTTMRIDVVRPPVEPPDPPEPRERKVTPGGIIRGTLRTTGELMITFGLVILLFAAYEIWGKAAIVDAHQADLDQQLTQEWAQPTPSVSPTKAGGKALPPPPGWVLGRLYIPRLNKHWVITQGVSPADIRYSPGHYPNSAMPGEKGNFALAGHRMKSVFWDLDLLREGDKLIVETRSTWYIYAVVKTRVVRPTQIEVVSPRPPGVTPGELITLTTCNPKFNNYQRLIIHGSLLGSQSRADGRPADLGG